MKTIDTIPNGTLDFALPALRGQFAGEQRVIRERRKVLGVSIIQEGPLNDGDARPWVVDATTLQQVADLGNNQQKGLKARWTHPNMSADGLGKFLGRWSNFRIQQGANASRVVADLTVASVAMKGENSRGEWVLDMAESDPDAFGVSIAPVRDSEAMSELEDEDGIAPIRLRRLIAADVVDEPAATKGGLFGDGSLSIATAPAVATEALDQLFPNATPEVVRARALSFVETYLATRFGGASNQKEDAMADSTATQPAEDTATAALEEKLSALSSKLDGVLAANQAKTDEENREAVVQAERTRSNELHALAANAGIPDAGKRAEDWVSKGLSVEQAKASLFDARLASGTLTKGDSESEPEDHAEYRREYRDNPNFAAEGMSVEDYIASRQQDDTQADF